MFYSTVTLDSVFEFGELGLGYNPPTFLMVGRLYLLPVHATQWLELGIEPVIFGAGNWASNHCTV